MQTKYTLCQFSLFILCFWSTIVVAQSCDIASDLLFRAYFLPAENQSVSQQKLLLTRSLQLCPNRPRVNSTLATILFKQGQYSEAAKYFKQALNYDKKLYQAWYGLGEAYFKLKLYTLSLEAHLQACQHEKDSKERVQNLLEQKRYLFTIKGDIIDKESLLVLYDKPRWQLLNCKVADCGFPSTLNVQPLHIFLNFDFRTGQANIDTTNQIIEIAKALQQDEFSIAKIHGHSDNKPFLYVSKDKSDELNFELSKTRAINIGNALIEHGVAKERLEMFGHGYTKPFFFSWLTPENKRVEIEVEYVFEE